MVAGCRRFYLTQGGEGCWDLANAAGISLEYVANDSPLYLNLTNVVKVISMHGTQLWDSARTCGKTHGTVLVSPDR